MGLSVYLGYVVCQNAQGEVLAHITNEWQDYLNHPDKVKVSKTNAPCVTHLFFSGRTNEYSRQLFHTDECDIVGLLFCAAAESGGASSCVSTHTVWNDLRKERPDILKLLTAPVWYVDRKGEVTEGQGPYIQTSIFMLEPGGRGRVYIK